MKKSNIILITITIIVLLALVIGATYAYFATGNLNITNVANSNTVTERNDMVFDTLGGGMSLNITAANMVEAKQGNVAASNSTTLTVNFTANTDYSMVCTYDIVYEWTSTDRYTTHSSGVTSNEFTIQGILTSNEHVFEGTNSISSEKDLSKLSYTNGSAKVVSGAQIDGTGNTMSTAVWTLSSKFYNVDGNQSALSGKTFAGKFKVDNVSCVAGKSNSPTSYWFYVGNYYQFPNYNGTLQSSGPATGHNIYIGMGSTKYYACGYYASYGHEVCLSQPYTQYGLTGHNRNSNFTSAQQTSAKQALYQVFVDAGVSINIDSDCSAGSSQIQCHKDDIQISIYKNGEISVDDTTRVDSDATSETCSIDYNNYAAINILEDWV